MTADAMMKTGQHLQLTGDRMLLNHTNQTEEDLFSCYSPSVVGYRYFAVLWGCAVTVTGTVGNMMTILAFTLDPRLRTRFNVLIVNLAVADFLYCLILQPISVDSYLHLRWRSGQLWCSLFGLLLFLSNSVSIITLCLVAGSRYLLVAKRMVFDRVFSDRGLILLLFSSWALGLASFGPLWPVFVFVPQVCTCSFHRSRGRPYTTILLFFYFFVGLGCVGAFYVRIYKRVQVASQALHRHRRKPAFSGKGKDDSGVESGTGNTYSCEMSSQADTAQNQNEVTSERTSQFNQSPATALSSSATDGYQPDTIFAPTSSTTAASSGKSATSGDDGEYKRVTCMCFTVFLCFVGCFIPFLLLNIVDKHNRAPQVLHMFCANLTWVNSCINPVLYAVMNRQFRQAYHLLLTRAAAPFTALRA
ncbi:G-protein coupled receptor 84 [Solea senegalensis]|uniref:G-protein coupled receptor 84 n=1 Tax=Solea senegalensis TaxID=28829 RepID=A0AAV6QP33_SOLSE|nr:G-protein coupled receptor 84 isoform X2 [Solea senegalensis]KAG7493819.1 G-protein coupled receptor 84 [Solea senegalensis]